MPERSDVIGCVHKNFQVVANISRCTRSDDDQTVVAYYCELRVKCTDCTKPFEFIGLPMGMGPSEPRCSVDAQEARMPIKPFGETMPIDVTGYGVHFYEA
jgi:hypothetical protein